MRVQPSFLHRFLGKPVSLRVALCAAISVFAIALSVVFFVASASKPDMGVTLALDDQGWTVSGVDYYGVAVKVGIVDGDRPLEVNGQPASTFLAGYQIPGSVTSVLITQLKVIDDNGLVKSVALKGSSPTAASLTELIGFVVTSLIFWAIGLYVFFKRPNSMAARLLCFCSLCFGLLLSANYAGERLVPAAFWIAVAATAIAPWLLLHFFFVLPDERAGTHKNLLVFLIYLPPLVTMALFPFVGYAAGQALSGFRTFRLLEYGLAFLAVIGVAVWNYSGRASPKTRQQMKIVLASCLAALLPFLILYMIPQMLGGQGIVPPGFSILFIVFIPLGLGYAVVTQKLMDIDVIIRRGVVYGLITLTMAAVLSLAVIPATLMRVSLGVPEQVLLSLALGAVATVLFGPTKRGVEFLVDRFFYKDRYDYRQTIHSFSMSVNKLKEFADVSRLTVGASVHTLNLAGGCLFVRSDSGIWEVSASQGTFAVPDTQVRLMVLFAHRESQVEFPNSASAVDPDVAFIIPLVAGEVEAGLLCLSHKLSRQEFSADDEYLLQGLVSVAAVALRSAMLIRDVSVRDTFVSIASHELRTPLTSILGYSELLLTREPPDSATRRKWSQSIFDNGRNISAMVDDLLNVTRIQSGKVAMRLEKVKLSDIVDERLPVIRESTSRHEFIIRVAPDLPRIIVDHDKFGQVLINLLTNAVKYSPNGGHITIAAFHDPQQQKVIVSLADEGIGIAPDDRDSLFTTFHRIQRPETYSIRGSGLGLYIVKEWTEQMGGTVWLESELNKGSTFFISIPAEVPTGIPIGGGHSGKETPH